MPVSLAGSLQRSASKDAGVAGQEARSTKPQACRISEAHVLLLSDRCHIKPKLPTPQAQPLELSLPKMKIEAIMAPGKDLKTVPKKLPAQSVVAIVGKARANERT